ncbi:hypothetical protein FEM48_ZijujUnG0062900 [Ziziphus jujuba var. spinosa]|uniref:Plant bHLH transcription factor ACT-like domain-containing protein n=1 Tax=Ziziphus jujuba var. spinosa TaxID=714518 RepID=A0A978U8Z1_ZIZJJ|nr:hypothetical protein FEM48_ZijujUnG0062900 [Ziziphus jujuba var. spinosa]
MVSREHKRAAAILHEKLHLLRSITNSHAVAVENIEKGFLINVFSEKSCPGLLVSVLETFEELGLNVLEARVSCADSFRLQAVGGENEEEAGEGIDAQSVKQAVLLAIKNWTETNQD